MRGGVIPFRGTGADALRYTETASVWAYDQAATSWAAICLHT